MKSESRYADLLKVLCVELGFCGSLKDGQPTHVDDFIPAGGRVTAEQFVDWVFRAENLDPDDLSGRTRSLKVAIRTAFVEHMGADAVDAEQLR